VIACPGENSPKLPLRIVVHPDWGVYGMSRSPWSLRNWSRDRGPSWPSLGDPPPEEDLWGDGPGEMTMGSSMVCPGETKIGLDSVCPGDVGLETVELILTFGLWQECCMVYRGESHGLWVTSTPTSTLQTTNVLIFYNSKLRMS
jgi:hypothetical protein